MQAFFKATDLWCCTKVRRPAPGNSKSLAETHIRIYYWPILIRSGALVRMLEHTNTPYEFISEKSKMAKVCTTWGGLGDTFAPPVLEDGEYKISQSIAATLYLGHKLGLEPHGFDKFKALQYCLDMVDVFENGLGTHNDDGETLKTFVSSERFKKLLTNLERGIEGPFFFGNQPSAVDFCLVHHLDWRSSSFFDPLKTRYGIDLLAPYPKIVGVYARIQATKAYQNYAGFGNPKPLKDEIIEAFNPSKLDYPGE